MKQGIIDWQLLGERIAELRDEKGMTQQQLAEKANLSVVYIGFIEQGKRHGTLDTYVQIVNALEVTMNDLLKDYMKPGSFSVPEKIVTILTGWKEKEQDAVFGIVSELAKFVRLFRD